MNNRRKLVVALGVGVFASPLISWAQQQGKVWRIGFLALRHVESTSNAYYFQFSQSLRELGYVEGKNLTIEWRSAEGKSERLPELAAELVKLGVDVIVAAATVETAAAQKSTTKIPIVMGSVSDPVGSGLVKSLAHPGGNTTGLSNIGAELGVKHLEMLRSMMPKVTRVAVLVSPNNPAHSNALKNIQAAALGTGIAILAFELKTPQEMESAFSKMTSQRTGGIIVARGPFFNQQVRQIAELAVKNRIPTISGYPECVEAGGLISYASNSTDQWRRVAIFVDKILKGAKPADLPVEQPTKFELVINMKSAKALGLTIPQSVLIRADRVIE
jgi:putative ABC transport system substrate-binding protein